MKENYWRQNELENAEFQRQKDNHEHDLKLQREKQHFQQQEREQQKQQQQRRKIWQKLARRKSTEKQAAKSTVLETKRSSNSSDHKTAKTLAHHHVDTNNDDYNDNNLITNNNVTLDDKQREEEILQILSEQQKRLFSATATATTKLEEQHQVDYQRQQQQQLLLQQQQQQQKDEREFNLSFCGCGFLGIYHVGVASCFHEYAPQLSMHKISGSSAGALVAVAHICGNLQLAYATTDILRVAIDARARALGPFHPSFDINAIVREALEKGLPDDVHLKANGKLHVSLTRVLDGENVIISEFNSKEDVIQVLLCSCYIPFWSGLVPPKYRGVTYIDGGFSNNLLTLDDKTITVSPFSGEADICPQDDTFNLLQVSLSNTSFSLSPNNLYRLSHALLPPSPEILSDLCEQGFADGIRFLQRMKLISCTKCLEIRSSLLVTTNGEDMEEAFTSELEDAVGGSGGNGPPPATSGTALDDVTGWKRFSSNSSGSKSSTASAGAAIQETTHLVQQQHYPHIILEQQEQKTIQISTGQRRESIRSTTSQVFIQQQQQQNSSKQQHQLDSSTSPTTALEPRQRFPSSWQLNVNNNRNATLITAEDNASLASCTECVQMRQRALSQPMPKQFSDRIRDACDTVNKSLSNWIYSHRPIKYLSYLAAPYFLPLDISLALVYKCWRRLPFIRNELINCIEEVVAFLIGIMKRMLARTTSTLLVESSLDWETRAIEYEKELISRTSHAAASTAEALKASQVVQQITAADSMAVDYKGEDDPSLSSSSDKANSVCSANGNATTNSESHYSLRITTDGVCLSKQSRHSTSSSQLHSLEDTFDSIVDVTSNQEARIFAYYFRDAKNRLQVTEIFDYQRASVPANNTDSNSASGTCCSDQPTTNMQQLHQSQHQQPPMEAALPAPGSNGNNNITQ